MGLVLFPVLVHPPLQSHMRAKKSSPQGTCGSARLGTRLARLTACGAAGGDLRFFEAGGLGPDPLGSGPPGAWLAWASTGSCASSKRVQLGAPDAYPEMVRCNFWNSWSRFPWA